MNKLIKLLTFTLIFSIKNTSISAMDLTEEEQVALATDLSLQVPTTYESKIDQEHKIQDEVKKQKESSILDKVNAYRTKCLEECGLYKDINSLVQEYDPIEDKWECEKTITVCDKQGQPRRLGYKSLCPLPGNKLASATGKTIRIWNINSGKCETKLTGHIGFVSSLCLLSENKLAAGTDRSIVIWDLDNINRGFWSSILKRKYKMASHRHKFDNVVSLCPLPGNKFASAYCNGYIMIYNSGIYETAFQSCGRRKGYFTTADYAICPLPGNKLACGSADDNTIKIWNLNTYKDEWTLTGHTDYVVSLCPLPGNKLASGSWDNTIKIWDLNTNKYEMTLTSHTDHICALCPLPDNKLASGSLDKTIKIWNLKTGECEKTLKDHTSSVLSLCMLPDNKLASGSYDEIKIWSNPVYSNIPTDS